MWTQHDAKSYNQKINQILKNSIFSKIYKKSITYEKYIKLILNSGI